MLFTSHMEPPENRNPTHRHAVLILVSFACPTGVQDDNLGLANEIAVHLQGIEDLFGVEDILDEDVILVFHLQAALVSMG